MNKDVKSMVRKLQKQGFRVESRGARNTKIILIAPNGDSHDVTHATDQGHVQRWADRCAHVADIIGVETVERHEGRGVEGMMAEDSKRWERQRSEKACKRIEEFAPRVLPSDRAALLKRLGW